MRAVVQRVREARVTVGGQVTGKVDAGLLILLGVAPGDSEEQARWLARKLAGLRIFEDVQGKMSRSLLDITGDALVVSQFTLFGDVRKGRRPSFSGAAHPSHAQPLYERFCVMLEEEGVGRVERGVFGAMMEVELLNEGPVTLVIDTP